MRRLWRIRTPFWFDALLYASVPVAVLFHFIPSVSIWIVGVAYVGCYGLLMVPPFVLWRRRQQIVKRTQQGRCTHCGYLLRGLTHNVCPECGTPFYGPRARDT